MRIKAAVTYNISTRSDVSRKIQSRLLVACQLHASGSDSGTLPPEKTSALVNKRRSIHAGSLPWQLTSSPPKHWPTRAQKESDQRIANACENARVWLICLRQRFFSRHQPSTRLAAATINYKSDCRSCSCFLCVWNRLVCFVGEPQWSIAVDGCFLSSSQWANTCLINSKYLAGQSHTRRCPMWPSAKRA